MAKKQSETGPAATTNSFIERQKSLLAELESAGEASTPISEPETPGTMEDSPAPPANPTPVPPPAATPEPANGEELQVLLARTETLEHELSSANGRLGPVQRQLAALNAELATVKQERDSLKAATSSQPLAPEQGTRLERANRFKQVYEDMVENGIDDYIEEALTQKLGAKLDKLEPLVKKQELSTQEEMLLEQRREHLAPIYQKHKDAADIVKSPDFGAYVESLPSFARNSVIEMMRFPENHPQENIMGVFDEYKASRIGKPKATQPPVTPDPGQMATDPRRIPTSTHLASTAPTGPQPLTQSRLRQLNRALTVERSLYTPEQIAGFKRELEDGETAAVGAGRGAVPTLRTLT